MQINRNKTCTTDTVIDVRHGYCVPQCALLPPAVMPHTVVVAIVVLCVRHYGLLLLLLLLYVYCRQHRVHHSALHRMSSKGRAHTHTQYFAVDDRDTEGYVVGGGAQILHSKFAPTSSHPTPDGFSRSAGSACWPPVNPTI